MKNLYMKILLCMLMVVLVFTGCANQPAAPTTTAPQSSTAPSESQPAGGPQYKK